jgi:hypothetical protein
MKRRFMMESLRVAGLAVAVSGAVVTLVGAQNVTVDWFTVDAGGGESAGGPYLVSGTIGQADAGGLTSGTLIVEGGFWPGVFLAPRPRLFIMRSGPNAVISWSPVVTGDVLQVSDRLAPAHWLDAPGGSSNPVSIPLGSGGNGYYRLLRR